jgi:SAM-dependent methyltransferase
MITFGDLRGEILKLKNYGRRMLQDQLKWNEKYQTKSTPHEPSSIVKQYSKLAGGNKALDIAAGNGRNALFLAVDLDNFDIPDGRYELIINIKYLNRRLFPYIRRGLAPGGILIFQTFVDAPSDANNDPICRDYRLRKNELLRTFLSFSIVYYKEGRDRTHAESAHLASLIAQKDG